MTITAKYSTEDNSICGIRLEPGDNLASLNVQAASTIPAYTIPAHTRPAFTLDGVDYPAKDVPAEDVAEVQIPAGEPTTHYVPTRSDNPVWVEFLRRLEAGEVDEPEAWEAPPPGPIIVAKFDFWDRLTEQEAADVEAVIQQQTVKNRRAFETAQTFRSDSALWPLLVQLAEATLGKARAKVVLAAS